MPTPSGLVRTIARRFLLSKNSEGFLSLISGVSVTGVAVGVAALVVVTSVINGFEGELVQAITGMNGDVLLYTRGNPVSNAPLFQEKILKAIPETKAVSASFVTELMVGGASGVAGAVMEGVDPATLAQVTTIPSRIREGRLPEKDGEVLVGSALAERIGAHVGDRVRLIIPFAGEGLDPSKAEHSAPKALDVTVSGILHMGFYQYDSKYVIGLLSGVQAFLGQPNQVTSFRLKLSRGADPAHAADVLNESFGYPFKAKYWGELNRNLLYAIKLEKAVITVILTAIIIVAAFNVISALMMMIHDKGREIAILKTMGFSRRAGFNLFLWIGFWIGAVGALLGLGIGLGLNQVIARTHLIKIPADIYYIGFLPVVVRWQEVTLISILGILICFFATLYPALVVARRSPIEGLRYE